MKEEQNKERIEAGVQASTEAACCSTQTALLASRAVLTQTQPGAQTHAEVSTQTEAEEEEEEGEVTGGTLPREEGRTASGGEGKEGARGGNADGGPSQRLASHKEMVQTQRESSRVTSEKDQGSPSSASDPQESIADSQLTSDPQESIADSQLTSEPQESIADSQLTSEPQESIADSQLTSYPRVSIADSQLTSASRESITDSQLTSASRESIADSQLTSDPQESIADSQLTSDPRVSIPDSQLTSEPREPNYRLTSSGCQQAEGTVSHVKCHVTFTLNVLSGFSRIAIHLPSKASWQRVGGAYSSPIANATIILS